MKHICFVTDEIFPLNKGGIGSLLYKLINNLSQSNEFRISILIFGHSVADTPDVPQLKFKNSTNIKVYTLDQLLSSSKNHVDIPLWAFHFEEYHNSYKICSALLHINDSDPIDVIEFNDYLGYGYVTIKLKKLIYNSPIENTKIAVRLHGSSELCLIADDENIYTKRKQVISHMEKYSMRNCDLWIAASKSISAYYSKYYNISKQEVISIPDFYRSEKDIVHKRTLNKKQAKILFYGKIQRLKGIEEFIRAGVKLLTETGIEFTFEIYGSEINYYSTTQSYINDLKKIIPLQFKNNFQFHGPIKVNNLNEIAINCDLAVIPSRFETFCLAAHELNWIGIPLVLNRIDAFKDYFSENNCYYYEQTTQSLFETIKTIYTKEKSITKQWNGADIKNQIKLNDSTKTYTSITNIVNKKNSLQSNSPLVSIIVPYYNMEKYIDSTLKSIIQNKYKNIEVIIVNDGSSNELSNKKFEELKKDYNYQNFYFYSKKNGGLGSARNYGIDKANGKYLLPLDSDDIVHNQYIELCVNALEKNPNLQAVNSYVNFFMDGTMHTDIVDYVIPYDLVQPLILVENRAGVACSLFRAETLKSIRYNEKLTSYEDWEIWWKFSEKGYEVETLPLLLYHYRRRLNSMINEEGLKKHNHHLEIIANENKKLLTTHSFEVYNLLLNIQNESLELKNTNLIINSYYESNQIQTIKNWYHNEYEVLPLWYKRFGHLLKVITGKRTFKSLIKKD